MNLKKINWYMVILHIFLVVLAIQVLYLAKQNRDMQALLTPSPIPTLEVGEEVAAQPVQDVSGGQQTLSFAGSDKETLLFVFNTTCPACKQNQTNWKELYEAVQDRYNVVGVSLHPQPETQAYIEENQLPFPVVLPESIEAFAGAFKIQAIPQTIHVDRDGKVREVKVGALNKDAMAQLSETAL